MWSMQDSYLLGSPCCTIKYVRCEESRPPEKCKCKAAADAHLQKWQVLQATQRASLREWASMQRTLSLVWNSALASNLLKRW